MYWTSQFGALLNLRCEELEKEVNVPKKGASQPTLFIAVSMGDDNTIRMRASK
jgi:hypothetical protein